MKAPERKIIVPEGFMLLQPNKLFDTKTDATKFGAVRIWRDKETGKFCCLILADMRVKL